MVYNASALRAGLNSSSAVDAPKIKSFSKFILLDVRPAAQFSIVSLPGSFNIPLGELRAPHQAGEFKRILQLRIKNASLNRGESASIKALSIASSSSGDSSDLLVAEACTDILPEIQPEDDGE